MFSPDFQPISQRAVTTGVETAGPGFLTHSSSTEDRTQKEAMILEACLDCEGSQAEFDLRHLAQVVLPASALGPVAFAPSLMDAETFVSMFRGYTHPGRAWSGSCTFNSCDSLLGFPFHGGILSQDEWLSLRPS